MNTCRWSRVPVNPSCGPDIDPVCRTALPEAQRLHQGCLADCRSCCGCRSFEKSRMRAKVVIVTGGARGIGCSCTLELARQGFGIALVDLLVPEMEQARAELQALGCWVVRHEAEGASFAYPHWNSTRTLLHDPCRWRREPGSYGRRPTPTAWMPSCRSEPMPATGTTSRSNVIGRRTGRSTMLSYGSAGA